MNKSAPQKSTPKNGWINRLPVLFLIFGFAYLSFQVTGRIAANRKLVLTAEAASVAKTLEADLDYAEQTLQVSVTRINPLDGMLEVYIPAGVFTMGDPLEGSLSDRNSIPQREVYLDPYWIARTPVTNAMYRQCFDAGACPKHPRQKLDPHYYDPAYDNHPVVFVNWDFAAQYCQWSGGRLPTEAQWEKAARGADRRTYPWGSAEPKPELANVGDFYDTTLAAGSLPLGVSPYGVLDMGGNVREWVQDWYKDNYRGDTLDNPTGPKKGEKRVLRGAAWNDPLDYAKVTNRLAHEPDSPGWNRGFRCAYDP